MRAAGLMMVVAACGARAPVAGQASPLPDEGIWELTWEGAPAWQHHAFALEGRHDGKLRGRLWIDRSLGPEGRAPTADERLNELAFEIPPGPGLRVVADVGELAPMTYTVDLAPNGAAWAGTVKVGDAPPATATATPGELRQLRPWIELPRAR